LRTVLRHPFRVTGRALWLAATFLLAGLDYAGRLVRVRGKLTRAQRAAWLQFHARRVLPVLGAECHMTGPVPAAGLLVCNHLSYLDVIVLAAQARTMFVAKREVKGWPIFGLFARMAGTIFVDRERRRDVNQRAGEIEAALDGGALVVLFPEGTSSDGSTVLPFKSSLLEPATAGTHPVSAGCLAYELDDGAPGEDVCYWKDMTLAPHLIKLLSKSGPRCFVNFRRVENPSRDRKELAAQLHEEVRRMNRPMSSASRREIFAEAGAAV